MAQVKVRQKFYVKEVIDSFESLNKSNVQDATTFLVEQTKRNITRVWHTGKNPSKPGEFPHAVTGKLAKSIRGRTVKGGERKRGITWTGYVSIGEDYGVILETSPRLNRSFLVRTMQENKRALLKYLTRRKRG
jgi:hypothetical protein